MKEEYLFFETLEERFLKVEPQLLYNFYIKIEYTQGFYRIVDKTVVYLFFTQRKINVTNTPPTIHFHELKKMLVVFVAMILNSYFANESRKI